MKKVIYINLFLFFCFSQLSYSQWNCSTAIHDQDFVQLNLPPPGTVAGPGPDYGCLTQMTRPVWGYFTACDTTNYFMWLNPNLITDTMFISVIIWGPFTDQNFACNNLTSANILYCDDMVPHTSAYFSVSNVWTAQPGEFYYYMITTSDTNTVNFYSTFHHIVQSITPGTFPLNCFTCNNEVSLLLRHNICLVSFDSTSQKTMLTWEKIPNAGVDGYIIYRGPLSQSIMDSVGYVSETQPGEFIDLDSHPLQYGENFRIVPVDSCGNRYPNWFYMLQPACFLQTTPAGNNTVNLNWNNFGISYTNEFEPVQYIRRGSSIQSMQIIDTIPNGIINYTDITAPPGQQFYSIERRRYSACNPLRTSSNTPYLSSMSNPSNVSVTGIPVLTDENHLIIHPVPVVNTLNMSFRNYLSSSNKCNFM